MNTGDQTDLLARLQRVMPINWFTPAMVPIRDAILTGFANCFAFAYSAIAYIKLQTRLATATDGFLDLYALDFFGDNLQRQANQADGSFRGSITSLLFRHRSTREAIIEVIQQLLGTIPLVIEPNQASDTGAYGNATNLAYSVPGAGVWGSNSMPYECFVTVFVPVGSIGVPFIAGYTNPQGAYATGSQIEYINASLHGGISALTLQNIYQALDSVRPVCGKIWVSVVSQTSQGN